MPQSCMIQGQDIDHSDRPRPSNLKRQKLLRARWILKLVVSKLETSRFSTLTQTEKRTLMLLTNFTDNQTFVRICFCIPCFLHKKGGKYILFLSHSLSKWLMLLFVYDILCDCALALNCMSLALRYPQVDRNLSRALFLTCQSSWTLALRNRQVDRSLSQVCFLTCQSSWTLALRNPWVDRSLSQALFLTCQSFQTLTLRNPWVDRSLSQIFVFNLPIFLDLSTQEPLG